jgi:hypothetical protein
MRMSEIERRFIEIEKRLKIIEESQKSGFNSEQVVSDINDKKSDESEIQHPDNTLLGKEEGASLSADEPLETRSTIWEEKFADVSQSGMDTQPHAEVKVKKKGRPKKELTND